MTDYIVTFEGARLDANGQKRFELLLTNHRLIGGWSSPFKGTYFLKSTCDSAELISDSIDDFFDQGGLFVGKIQRGSKNSNGRLLSEIWEFLRTSDA